jgi:hypothetical protein
MRARHKNAVTLNSLAASRVTAGTIGSKASRHDADSTIAPARAIGSVARDMVDALRQRPRIDGKLSLRWQA